MFIQKTRFRRRVLSEGRSGLSFSRYIALLLGFFFLCGFAVGKDSVATSAEEICPLLPGMEVPDVELVTTDGKSFSLKSETASQPSILIFYRGGW